MKLKHPIGMKDANTICKLKCRLGFVYIFLPHTSLCSPFGQHNAICERSSWDKLMSFQIYGDWPIPNLIPVDSSGESIEQNILLNRIYSSLKSMTASRGDSFFLCIGLRWFHLRRVRRGQTGSLVSMTTERCARN